MHQRDRPERARRHGDAVPQPTAYARTYRAGEITVIELRGEIDLGSAGYVDAHLEAAAQWPDLVVFDLCGLEFIDCFGLSLLVRARRRILERGGRIRVACGHPQTRRLLTMTGLDGMFEPVPSLDEALAP